MHIEKFINKNKTQYKVGDLFLDTGHYPGFIKIKSIEGENISTAKLEIYHEDVPENWHSYGSTIHDEYIPINSVEEALSTYQEITSNPENFILQEEKEAETSELATITNNVFQIQKMQDQYILLANKIKIAETVTKALMDKKTRELAHIANGYYKIIGRLQKVIDAIQMYLGINTEIEQLKKGISVDSPIYLRQMVLYMDEEVGDPRIKNNQIGIDFKSIEDFDKWLLQPGSLEQILPEPKGIVAIKISRQKRTYSKDFFDNEEMNERNQYTYFLIRNGENLYRLWTDIIVGERLYPTVNEMEVVIQKILDEGYNHSVDMEKIANVEYVYKRNALIIQGLIDHSDIFKPLPECNLLKPETYKNGFIFVRDDENLIGDGHLPWKEWKNQINSDIKIGSRVLIAEWREHALSRFIRDYGKEWKQPPNPKTGVYQVMGEEFTPRDRWDKNKKKQLFIRYNPEDEIWYTGWEYDPHIRKNKLTWFIYKSDDFVFNFDKLNLEDINFYLSDRQARKHIVNFIYLLWNVREFLLKELDKEKDFIKLVINRTNKTEKEVIEAVNWWKFKNKWKRAINSDDAKALRMIEQKLKRNNQKEK